MNMKSMADTLPEDFPEIRAQFDSDVEYRRAMQKLAWLYWIPIRMTIPANGEDDETLKIKSDAHFECHLITGDYTTLDVAGADSGVNAITVRISDQSNDLKLFNSAVPMNLFSSPGRVLSVGVLGNPSNSLFYPAPFYHIFGASGGILCEFYNSAATDNIVNLNFFGRKLRAKKPDNE